MCVCVCVVCVCVCISVCVCVCVCVCIGFIRRWGGGSVCINFHVPVAVLTQI